MSRRLLLALLLAAARPAHALDPQRAPSQYAITQWNTGFGLPGDTVHAVLPARDRYLWLGTSAGLVRFDGARFLLFNAASAPGFGDGGVSALCEDEGGVLHVGTTSGSVLRYEPGGFRPLRFKFAGNETTPMRALVAARGGTVWIGAENWPLNRAVGGEVQPVPDDIYDLRGPAALALDGEGLWVGLRQRGLYRYEGGRLTLHAEIHEAVQALHVAADGAVWVGTSAGLGRYTQGRLRWTVGPGAPDNVTALHGDRDGNLWIGTAGGGLLRWRDGRFARLGTREGLADDDVRAVAEDHEGNLWVGTATGLTRLSDPPFVTYTQVEGLPAGPVRAVAGTEDGRVFIGLESGEVARLEQGRVAPVGLPPGRHCGVLLLHPDGDGAVWVSRDDGRVFRIRGAAVTEHTPRGLPAAVRVTAVFEDERGPAFLLRRPPLDVAVGRLHPAGHGRVAAAGDWTPELGYVTQAHRDGDGRLWLASLRGLTRLEGSARTLFAVASGPHPPRVRWMSPDGDGSLWLATSSGLGRFADGAVARIGTEHGLPENYLRIVLDDGRGFLWIASKSRVFRVDKREALEVIAGRRPRLDPLTFDVSDGLATTEALVSSSPGFRARDGRLWLATSKGVSVIDPARIAATAAAPPVVIESVTVDGATTRQAEYRPGRGEVTVDYTALTYRHPHRIRFRHRLAGLDEDWIEAGSHRRAYYSTLPPGSYVFSVMASDATGAWSGTPATFAFRLRPPLHRRPVFYAAGAAALVALGFLGHRLRLAQTRARLGAIITERTRIARELHDTLAQSLAGMSLQMEAAMASMPEDASLSATRRHLELARSMVGVGLTEVRRSIWVLRAQAAGRSSNLGATLSHSLGQLTSDTGVALSLDVRGEPRPLSPEVERNLLRIAHEAVLNAVRHAEARRIEAALHFVTDGVRLHVRDDGRGFDPAAAAAGGQHFGLVGMAERARGIGGELRVESAAGHGTEIQCRLPYEIQEPADLRGEREP